jgi:hypothetical protein
MPTKKVQSPLKQSHLDALNKVLAATAETEAYCAQCEEAGIDIDRERRMNAEQAEIARKIKSKFFPNAK